MDRRTFLKAAAAAGLAVAAPVATTKEALAADTGLYDGPYWFFVLAQGGWCPTDLVDPKGNANGVDSYNTGDIMTAGNINYAPLEFQQQFFEAHYNRTLVINGIDMSTNGHEQGRRYSFSGKLAEGHPALAALIAAKAGPALPMAFISNGGYDVTNGIIAPTRADSVDTLPKIAFSNKINANGDAQFHSDYAMDRIRQAAQNRLERQQQKIALPHVRSAMSTLHTARVGEQELRDVLQYLPDNINGNSLQDQASVALASFRAGLGVSVNMRMGGFDTHGNHDARHFPRLADLLRGVDFIWQKAEEMNIADKVIVVVGSDFGRTPGYNGNNGKDHWSVNSMMVMSEPGNGIPTNTVIGKTTDGHKPMKVNPQTLQPDENGVRIKPEHIHSALRKLAGIEQDSFSLQFPLDVGQELPLLDE